MEKPKIHNSTSASDACMRHEIFRSVSSPQSIRCLLTYNSTLMKVLPEGVALQIRTIAVILMVFVVALLFLNSYLRSGLIWLTSIAMVIVAVIVYFIPTLRK